MKTTRLGNSFRGIRIVLIVLAVWIVLIPCAAGQGYVLGRADFPVGNVTSLVARDFNGDGKLDVAAVGSNGLSILIGKPDGMFLPAVTYAAGGDPVSIIAVDLNGDGQLDLAVVTSTGVSIYLANGDGTFQAHVDYAVGAGPTGIVAADFNADDVPDLAVINHIDSTVSILFNKGDGTFSPQKTFPTPVGPTAIAVGDFNRDLIPDLAITAVGDCSFTTASGCTGTVAVLLGVFVGSIFPVPSFLPASSFAANPEYFTPYSIVAGDFNRDGNLDLAVGSSSNPPDTFGTISGAGAVTIFLGNGDGTFQPGVDNPEPDFGNIHDDTRRAGASFVMSGDFNGDGILDLVGSRFLYCDIDLNNDTCGHGFNVWLGKGDGTFSNVQGYQNDITGPLASGDFNGDGAQDLAIGTKLGISVVLGRGRGLFPQHVTYNTTEEPAISGVSGDFNDDGIPDLAVTVPSGVAVFLGKGDGTFQAESDFAISQPGVNSANIVVADDFNQDGEMDLAIGTKSSVSILFGRGDGTFRPHVDYPIPSTALAIVSRDFNGDGRPDLAVSTSSGISILLAKADGTFQPQTVVSSLFGPLAADDFNRDGRADLAVSTNNGVSVLLGNGNGTFQPNVNYAASGGLLATADFNGDGKVDLVTATSPHSGTGGYSVLLGKGDGTFQPRLDGPTGTATIAVADMNHDGKPDLLLTNNKLGFYFVTILFGSGDGAFQPSPGGYDVGWQGGPFVDSSPVNLIADFNMDGKLDWAVVNNNVSVYLSTPSSATSSSLTASFSPNPVVFATHDVNTTSGKTATFTNNGLVPLAIANVTVTGDFAETSNCGTSLAPGANCTFQIQFTPTVSGIRTGTLTVTDNAANSPQTLTLSGTGAPTPTIEPTSINFGEFVVGGTGGPRTVALTNTTGSTLVITSITTTGDFQQTNNCTGSVAISASCSIKVLYKPTAVGSRTGTLTIIHNAASSPQIVSLIGTAVLPQMANISPTSIVFASHEIGTTSGPRTVTLTNPGARFLNITNVSITGDFLQSNDCPAFLGPVATCTFKVEFQPSAVGTRTGSLIITDNSAGGPTQTVTLKGTSVAGPISVTPTSIVFASHNLGIISGGRTVQITNPTTSTLHLTSITTTGDFSHTNECGASLASGATCRFQVQFTPTAPGTRTGSLTIIDDGAGSPRHVALSGTGVSTVTLNPTFIVFATHNDGTTSGPRTVTLTNSTISVLHFSSITTTGDFSQTNNCGASLAPFATCTFQIRFAPTAPGPRTGLFTITDSGSGSPRTVTLSGTGAP
jgi:hypothetical protein